MTKIIILVDDVEELVFEGRHGIAKIANHWRGLGYKVRSRLA